MKKIEQLGASPSPWRALGGPDDGDMEWDVFDADGKSINKPYLMQADARLVSAAPELYEMLREAVVEMCWPCSACEGGKCTMTGIGACFVQRWRAALANAAGEEVSR